jgi:hypothetical protein
MTGCILIHCVFEKLTVFLIDFFCNHYIEIDVKYADDCSKCRYNGFPEL